jgi:NTE family protein
MASHMTGKLTVHGQGAARAITLEGLMRNLGKTLPAWMVVLAIFSNTPVLAQQAPAETGRPRIGLVLSGGGARGAAHVGVLRVLEEMHIPVDAVAGTSIGAVVGGLYASGLSAGQIKDVLDSVDWADAFSDRPARRGLNFHRRQEDRDFLVRFPLGFRDGGFLLPSGLIQGQKLTHLLRQFTLPVAGITDFDQLPTPFRAVATDLETGAAVVIGSGDLTTAMHASLSAPGVFAPVLREGRLLVDGGVANNVPIDVARAMGVDRLIVVDVGLQLWPRDRLGSITDVTEQMLTILVRSQMDQQTATLSAADVLLRPDLQDTSSYSFTDLARSVRVGAAAAAAARDQLAGFAMSPEDYARYTAARRREPYSPGIRAVLMQPGSEEYAWLASKLFGDVAGTAFDPRGLGKRVDRAYAQGHLELLDYQLQPVAGSNPALADLAWQVRENAWGPNYMRVGLRLQDDFEGNTAFDAAVRLVLAGINNRGAEWVWDGQVGGNPRLGSHLYLPFSLESRWFLEPSALWQVRDVPQFEDEDLVGELRVRTIRYGAALGRELGNSGEIRVGAEREQGRSRQRFGDADAAPVDFEHNELYLRYGLDSLDSAAFPRRGSALTLEWRGQLANRRSQQVSDAVAMDFRQAHSWGRNTAVAWISGGALLDSGFADERSWYSLGGFLNLSGLPAGRLTGPNYGVARLIYYRRMGSGEGVFNSPVYAGMSAEAGNVWDRRRDMSLSSARGNASVFVGIDTFLGPAWLAAGFDSRGGHAFFLSLGRGF